LRENPLRISNVGGDRKQDYFADGIITALSKWCSFAVMPTTSTWQTACGRPA
jgi:hypothetical protein